MRKIPRSRTGVEIKKKKKVNNDSLQFFISAVGIRKQETKKNNKLGINIQGWKKGERVIVWIF